MSTDGISHQLPSSQVAKEFGEVNVRRTAQACEVTFTILMEPQGVDAEGWQTGVALDGSGSMKAAYGRSLKGTIPPEVMTEYVRKGWAKQRTEDGRNVRNLLPDGHADALKRGYVQPTPNVMQDCARQFIGYLAGNLDADGGTTVAYWACGDGSEVEVLGDFTEEQCRTLAVQGPVKATFGRGTQLVPAVRYFVDRFKDAKRGMYLFVTDGRLDDLMAVKGYTTKLAKDIEAKKRNPVKCVLIGVGSDIDEDQMEQLDDLDTGTSVDIWDHKIAAEMRGLVEIFAEVVEDNQVVAPTGMLYDGAGQLVKRFTDGVPAKISVTLPASSNYFELEVAGQRIRQTLVLPPA